MSCLGNIIWFVFSGFWTGIIWLLVGALWCLTILGIPIGLQCFKLAKLSFMPFGKEVYRDNRSSSLILNILWIIFGGIELAVAHVITGLVLCVTIIGIPFARQSFKLALLALFPFGAQIRSSKQTYLEVH